MSDTTQDAEKIEDIMALADEYAHRRWSAAVSACHFDKLGEKQADADAAEARAALDAAIRQAMGDDAAGVREGGAPQPTPYGLAGIEGDALVIRFTADACAFAFANDPQANDPRPLVVDKRQFLRDTLSEVTAEREDGQTPLTDMLDRAMVKAMENGSDALDYDAAGVKGDGNG